MAAVANLITSIVARTQNFEKGMKRSRKSVRSFGRAVKLVKRSLTGFFAVAGIGLGGAVIIAGLKRTFDRLDKIGKVATRLGVTAEGLQKIQFAAGAASIDVRKLDLGIQRMRRRMAEAAKGTGEAKEAIKTLGLNASKFGKLSVDKQMLTLARALSKVGDESEKLRLAFKLFDSEGVELLQFLKDGEAGLKRFFDEAKALGVVFSSREIGRIEQASTAMFKLGQIFEGVKARILIGFAPLLTAIGDHFVDMSIAGKNSGSRIVSAMESVAEALATVIDKVLAAKQSWLEWRAAVALANADIVKFFGHFISPTGNAGNFGKAFQEEANRLVQALADVMASRQGIMSVGERFAKLRRDQRLRDQALGGVERGGGGALRGGTSRFGSATARSLGLSGGGALPLLAQSRTVENQQLGKLTTIDQTLKDIKNSGGGMAP